MFVQLNHMISRLYCTGVGILLLCTSQCARRENEFKRGKVDNNFYLHRPCLAYCMLRSLVASLYKIAKTSGTYGSSLFCKNLCFTGFFRRTQSTQ